MSFLLNLISFLLIVFGSFLLWATSSKDIRRNSINKYANKLNVNSLSQYELEQANEAIDNLQLKSAFAIILGIGIIVARIFS